MAVLAAVGSKVRVDLYGFNWSLKSYERHKMSAEELIIQAVRQKYPNIQVHPTACKAALYSCDALCDTNQFRLAVDEANCHKQVRVTAAPPNNTLWLAVEGNRPNSQSGFDESFDRSQNLTRRHCLVF